MATSSQALLLSQNCAVWDIEGAALVALGLWCPVDQHPCRVNPRAPEVSRPTWASVDGLCTVLLWMGGLDSRLPQIGLSSTGLASVRQSLIAKATSPLKVILSFTDLAKTTRRRIDFTGRGEHPGRKVDPRS